MFCWFINFFINFLWLNYVLCVFLKILVWYLFFMELIIYRILISLLYFDVNVKMIEYKYLKSKLFDVWRCVFIRDRKILFEFNSYLFYLNMIFMEIYFLI